jgi:hypothetical protein
VLWSEVIIGKWVLTVSNYLHKGPLSIPAPLNERLRGPAPKRCQLAKGVDPLRSCICFGDRAADWCESVHQIAFTWPTSAMRLHHVHLADCMTWAQMFMVEFVFDQECVFTSGDLSTASPTTSAKSMRRSRIASSLRTPRIGFACQPTTTTAPSLHVGPL